MQTEETNVTYDIHPASLDDTAAVVSMFKAPISVWQRLNAEGRVEDMPYEALTLYERWLHGGAWMSVETGAIHLNHLLSGAGLPVVALENGRVVGYAEAYHSVEALPVGAVLHIAQLVTVSGAVSAADALISYFVQLAKTLHCRQVTVTRMDEDPLTAAAERRAPLKVIGCVKRFTVPARTGQVFFRAVEYLDPDPALINGWMMVIGRATSSRHMWERLLPRTWETIPQIRARKTHRLKFSAAGQEAVVVCEQGLYNPRSADVYCWTPKPLTSQLTASIKDWAHRDGYRVLTMLVPEDSIPMLGSDAEPDGYTQETCALELN
ncbi:MAG: hypothetical protein SF162_01535 [bacterium]|nr:hypothetical protein [bacterium]